MLSCVDVYVWLHLSWCVCTTLYVWRPEVRITSLFPPVFGLQGSTSGLQVCVANAFSRWVLSAAFIFTKEKGNQTPSAHKQEIKVRLHFYYDVYDVVVQHPGYTFPGMCVTFSNELALQRFGDQVWDTGWCESVRKVLFHFGERRRKVWKKEWNPGKQGRQESKPG